MSEISFQVDQFLTYEIAREGVQLGFIDTANGGYAPSLGEVLEYDGTTVVLHDGRRFTNAPQLRSAIREGWLTRAKTASHAHTQRPKSAGIQVRGTTQQGLQPPVKTVLETQRAEETTVVTVDERRTRREATNAEATRRVPFQSQEALQSWDRSANEASAPWSSGFEEIDDVALLLDQEMVKYGLLSRTPQEEDVVSSEDNIKAQAEADILDMLNSVEGGSAFVPETTPPPSVQRAPQPLPANRGMPVEYHDSRPTMPILRDEVAENSGNVVGAVRDQRQTVVEREREFALDVAKATPEHKSPAPKPRFGGVGAVVHDEQRDMGTIALSGSRAAIQLDESATVTSSGNEMIRMGDAAQVGTRQKTASPVETDQGVAVGRVLSPTHQTFTADARNTSASAIQRTAEGKGVKIEKYDVGPQEASVIATGDVEEARTGDSLEELLPEAAKPEPEVYLRPEEDPTYAAVRMLLPEFEWNKDRPLKERVAEALKHIKNPVYMRGILAVETELAASEIKKALAKALGSKG